MLAYSLSKRSIQSSKQADRNNFIHELIKIKLRSASNQFGQHWIAVPQMLNLWKKAVIAVPGFLAEVEAPRHNCWMSYNSYLKTKMKYKRSKERQQEKKRNCNTKSLTSASLVVTGALLV